MEYNYLENDFNQLIDEFIIEKERGQDEKTYADFIWKLQQLRDATMNLLKEANNDRDWKEI